MYWLKIISIYRKICNKIFSLLAFNGRVDISVDQSARIIGISNIKIGKNFYAGRLLWLEAVQIHQNKKYNPQIVIKDNVAINDFVHIAATNYVEIGNNVLMASNIYISDHNHGAYQGKEQSSPASPPNERIVTSEQKVIIGDNVWLGEGVIVLPGVEIEQGCIIGAGSVVTKSIPAYSVAVGNPIKIIKKYDVDMWIDA